MLEFIELKPTQKQYVVEVMNRFNHNRNVIELSEMKEYHQKMVEARDSGCPKLGYPNWLIESKNKVSKSVYSFPIPTEDELEDFHLGNVEAVISVEKFSPLFQKTVKEYSLL
jgi:hypothetical protein